MKLLKLSVNGYKNLISCDFILSNFNVLIGSNNSGKSNLLEIFSILDILIYGSDESKSSVFDGYVKDIGVIRSTCENKISNTLSIGIEYTEEIDKDTYLYNYEIVLSFHTKKLKDKSLASNNDGHIMKETFKYKNVKTPGRPNTVFERNENDVKKLPRQIIQKVDIKEPMISLISKIKDINDTLKPEVRKGIEQLSSICKTPTIYNSPNEIRNSLLSDKENISRYGKVLSLPLAEEIFKVINSKKRDMYKDILNEVLDINDIKAMDFQNFKFVTVKYSNNSNSTTLQQLSDGTLIALSIITYLFSKKYPIIAIEELENSLHPILLKKLIYLFRSEFSDTQIIITTHSPVLLNFVQIDDVSIITRDEYGAASIFRVKDKKEMVKKLNNPLSSFGDIFYISE